MTCIVGVIEKDRVVIGGDSAGVAGYDLIVRADTKVFRKGEFLFGFTSSFRMGQLLRYAFTPPALREGQETFEYMVTSFVDGVRACLKAGGYVKTDSGVESGGTFLVGFRGRLFEVEGDFQVGEPACDFNAVGCGQAIAKGALHATEGMPAHKRVEIALKAAERFSAGVRGPFTVVELEPPVKV